MNRSSSATMWPGMSRLMILVKGLAIRGVWVFVFSEAGVRHTILFFMTHYAGGRSGCDIDDLKFHLSGRRFDLCQIALLLTQQPFAYGRQCRDSSALQVGFFL